MKKERVGLRSGGRAGMEAGAVGLPCAPPHTSLSLEAAHIELAQGVRWLIVLLWPWWSQEKRQRSGLRLGFRGKEEAAWWAKEVGESGGWEPCRSRGDRPRRPTWGGEVGPSQIMERHRVRA